MATLQEKQRTGILSKLNSSGQSGEKKDLMERVRRTSEQGLGDPERSNIRRKEQDRPTLQRQADLTARTREREYGAKVGTPEFGRALAAEYAEKYDKDKPPGAPKQDFGGPKQIAEIEEGEDLISQMSREDIRKAQKELAEKSARYREALQGRGAPAEAVRTMAEVGEVGDVRDVEDPGFAKSYDEAVQFQEEEYGGGSLEREAALSEILGVDRQTRRESPRREDLIEGGRYAFDEFYEEAKAANPEGREEDWQDAAIKAYNRSKAEDAAEFARTFEVEDTAQVSGKMEDYAAKRAAELREERLKREAEAAKKKDDVVSKAVKRVQGKAPAQPVVTPQEAAERITPLLERYKGAAVPFDDFIQQITSVEEEPSIEEPAEPAEDAVKEEAPVATAPIESDEELTDAEREELEGVERSRALEEETERFRLDVAKQERAVQAATKRLEDLFEAHQVIADAPKKEDLIERSIAFQSEKYARARNRRDIPEMKNAQALMKSAEKQLQSLRQEVLNREALIRNLDPSNSVVFSPSEMMLGRVNLDRLQQVIQEAAGETAPEESPVEDLIADAIEEQGG